MRSAQEVIRDARVIQAPNGVCYTTSGEVNVAQADLERMIAAVPHAIAAALDRKAFEFFINVGHAFVAKAGVSAEFAELAWNQVSNNVRGETSLDAHEFRKQALAAGPSRIDEKAKSEYSSAAFSDAIAIYMLSLC